MTHEIYSCASIWYIAYIILSMCIVQCVQVDSGGKAHRKQRPFDFTKYNTRHVALKIAYLGWDYQVHRFSNWYIQTWADRPL